MLGICFTVLKSLEKICLKEFLLLLVGQVLKWEKCTFAKRNSQRLVFISMLPLDKREWDSQHKNSIIGYWFDLNKMHFGNCRFEMPGSTLFKSWIYRVCLCWSILFCIHGVSMWFKFSRYHSTQRSVASRDHKALKQRSVPWLFMLPVVPTALLYFKILSHIAAKPSVLLIALSWFQTFDHKSSLSLLMLCRLIKQLPSRNP